MVTQDIIRLRERILNEMHGGASHGAPSTRLIYTKLDGYFLELNHAGQRVVLTSDADLDRHLKRLGKFL